jgi:hypothetical protein
VAAGALPEVAPHDVPCPDNPFSTLELKPLFEFLRIHFLVWLIPVILVPLIVGLIFYLARAESYTPDSPFIYDLDL